VPNEEFREQMIKDPSPGELYNAAAEHGMITLRQDGMEKVKAGITTVEEVIRVTAA
jgi:type II secretory ATPase GspE/PulE/Tfp pilus assembly ATPase PilB-like protein